jgi:hypothetical protein
METLHIQVLRIRGTALRQDGAAVGDNLQTSVIDEVVAAPAARRRRHVLVEHVGTETCHTCTPSLRLLVIVWFIMASSCRGQWFCLTKFGKAALFASQRIPESAMLNPDGVESFFPLICRDRGLKPPIYARRNGSWVIPALKECGGSDARTRTAAIQQQEGTRGGGSEMERREVAVNRGSGELKKQ